MVAISAMPVTRPQQFILVPRYEGPADRSYITRNCNITLITVSSAVVIARIYTRKYISNSLGLDDLAAFVALVSLSLELVGASGADWIGLWQIFAVTTASLELDGIFTFFFVWRSRVRFLAKIKPRVSYQLWNGPTNRRSGSGGPRKVLYGKPRMICRSYS